MKNCNLILIEQMFIKSHLLSIHGISKTCSFCMKFHNRLQVLNISSKIEKGMKESSVIHNQIESDIPSLKIRLISRFTLSLFIFTKFEEKF
ncbi:hypothetical protein BpHYR1_045697 [Brachionus plicatilis]|uniref:Uncharacterized protein n=1 Tax=Brachionus plicatilis TaxID=10195 RepID=A0A3M7R1Q5_BRAPC|nr:hypothetical protein BpHYR1_045697 [Brachionus plicatilis]